jgi:hypothetical protein
MRSIEGCSRGFVRKTSCKAVQQLSQEELKAIKNDSYTVQEKSISVQKITDSQTKSNSRVPEAANED